MRKMIAMLLLLMLPLQAMADQTVVLTFVGDCTIGGEERLREFDYSFDGYMRRNDASYFFEKVQSVLAADDLTIANLEGVFTNWNNSPVKKTYIFRGPTSYVEVLTRGSVEAVSISNNHSQDYGYDGVNHTIRTLDEAGVDWFGSNQVTEKTWVWQKGNVKIGFVGMEFSYWYYKHRNQMRSQVEALKAEGCQVVVGVMHGGEEYRARHLRNQKDFAYAMLDYGADIVVGHHPHVLQGIEVRDGKTICYSLGNFVFGGNAAIRAPYTAMFQFTLTFTDDGTYSGHQLNIIPALPSGEREYNNYQPVLATGKDAEAVIKQIQYDTSFPLNSYAEGVGAMQDFVPCLTPASHTIQKEENP